MLATALHRILTIGFALMIGILALAFSVVAFSAIAAVGAVALAYAWWRQKFARPRMQPAQPGRRGRAEIIDLPSREVDRQ